MFPDPERPVWEQFFSKRHQQSYEGRPLERSDAEVFRIFQRANFSRLTDVEGHNQPLDAFLDPKDTVPQLWYDRFLPALVLATRLIKATPEFFCILALGEMGRFDDGSWGYVRDNEGKWLYELEEGADPKSKCQELFGKMSNIRFFTGKTLEDMDHAYATASHGYWPFRPFGDSSKRIATAGVQLHAKWMDFFSRPDYDDISADVKNRLLVHLAMVLVHELAHVWYAYRKLEYARQGKFKRYFALASAKAEPYFYDDEESAEIGHAWGRYAFNGEQQSDKSRASCYTQSSCLYLLPYGRWGKPREKPKEEPFHVHVLHPRLLQAFLSKDCWGFYDKVGTDPDQDDESIYILGRMDRAVAMRMFMECAGRVPSLAELRHKFFANNFIEEQIWSSGEAGMAQAGSSPTPSLTPPPDDEDDTSSWLIEFPPTPQPSPPNTPDRVTTVTNGKLYTDTIFLLGDEILNLINEHMRLN